MKFSHFRTFASFQKMQQTLLVVKPDGVKRRLCGDVITSIEKTLLVIVEMRMMNISDEFAKVHYEEHKDKAFFPELCASFSSGPVLAIVAEGYEAVRVGRIVLADIRSRYAGDSTHENVMHASDSEQSAQREILLWTSHCDCGSPRLEDFKIGSILNTFVNNRLTQQDLERAGYSSVDDYYKSQFPDLPEIPAEYYNFPLREGPGEF